MVEEEIGQDVTSVINAEIDQVGRWGMIFLAGGESEVGCCRFHQLQVLQLLRLMEEFRQLRLEARVLKCNKYYTSSSCFTSSVSLIYILRPMTSASTFETGR